MFVIALQQLEMLLRRYDRRADTVDFHSEALITSRVASVIPFLRILGVLSVYAC